MEGQQGFAQFNLYDIFSSFFPGALFLIGVMIPYVGSGIVTTELKIGNLVVWVILAFASGQFLQTIGGYVISGSDAFETRMRQITEEEESEYETTPMDIKFVENVREDFELDANYDAWKRIYKMILAQLESTSRNRTLRLQALYLAMRGTGVAMFLLAFLYVISVMLNDADIIKLSVPELALLPMIIITVGLGGASIVRANEFSEDTVSYMVFEYRLERDDA
ncbi:hypothetical protein SAMN04487950_4556 [Halogranum rubrum]|uniref:Uncharacterized protein n=1 Tax=Halogranum rubrum TaxID=553466 RepID=A0A1I4JLW9_9EURY|nr:hypothetical protein [Halogranum rubrum]SFL67193.1 hypothetical protein SAMN04487950_4556 [Halogranum rubrum]